ncbi:MAG: cysteine protease [Claussenomyces sp. TS43310]|nr:MAG: cysteine protease [Claussenomyces sp. TS43310]
MEAKALEAEARIDQALSREEALQSAIAATQMYMTAIKVSSNESERKRLKERSMRVLERAERIKRNESWMVPSYIDSRDVRKNRLDKVPQSSRTLSAREEILLLESSKLHGLVFPRWMEDPPDDLFERKVGTGLFLDTSEPLLSEAQQSTFAGWKRPGDAFRMPSSNGDKSLTVAQPTMLAKNTIDLIQDITTDCSVVASLCAAVARAEGGFPKFLSSIFFPYDWVQDGPKISNNGQYIFRFQFNGCSRTVIIDDRLPTSKTLRTLHVIDRQNPGLMWPALLEKAYLKVRGGYEFPGSNSGTDLSILSGWIPEQIFLQSAEIHPQGLWNRIYKAYSFGDVIVTLGTGRLSINEEEDLGLVGEHDYAVVDVKEVSGRETLLVKNPLCDGAVWKGSTGARNGHTRLGYRTPKFGDAPSASETLTRGTFWISFDEVVRNFESMYLNWNPGLFSHREDHHFRWEIPQVSPPGCLVHNPQYSIQSSKGGTVWILLSRHLTTEEHSILKSSTSIASHRSSPLGFISLYVFEANGRRVYLSEDAYYRGPFVDSPQTLARLDIPAASYYTIVVDQQALPLPRYSFTLSTYSRQRVKIENAEPLYPYRVSQDGAWKLCNAGGNVTAVSYTSNPQYSIFLPSRTSMTLFLETASPDLAVNVKLLWGGGYRISSITLKDVLCDSGEYRRGCALVGMQGVSAGHYTIVCSTFEAGQTGNFTLHVDSEIQCKLNPLASEAAGRLTLRLPKIRLAAGINRILAPVIISQLTRLKVNAYNVTDINDKGQSGMRSPLRISLEQGQGPHKTVIRESSDGSFCAASSGARLSDADVSPSMAATGGIWVVVERLGGETLEGDEFVDIEILSDVALNLGAWGIGSG